LLGTNWNETLRDAAAEKVFTRNQDNKRSVKAFYTVIRLMGFECIKIQDFLNIARHTAWYVATRVVCFALFCFCSLTETRWACLPTKAGIRHGNINKSG
jgi:hypothetical protein